MTTKKQPFRISLILSAIQELPFPKRSMMQPEYLQKQKIS